ncbi:MAG: hypothetical protein HYT47_02630 [Candidatus Vogelbacteria bacterium]|nr:hypothetical protein [Candidatus Vogelbacteria bacterium]
MSSPNLIGLTFHESRHGLQAKRFKGGVTTVYKPLTAPDVPSVAPEEMWVVEVSATPEKVLNDGQFRIIRVLPVLSLRHTAGSTVVLDLACEDGQWQSRYPAVNGAVTVRYLLDRESQIKPAHPGEAGRYVCAVTKLVSTRPSADGESCFALIAVAIISRVVTPRGARREKQRLTDRLPLAAVA